MPTLQTFAGAPTPAQDFLQVPTEFPPVPDEIQKRFGSASGWNEDLTLWYKQLVNGISDAQDSVASVANQTTVTGDLVIQQGQLTVAVQTETNARIAADGILAQRIVTVSAISGIAQNIKVQGTPPGGPALNDYWVDNAVPLTPVTYQWSGAAWVEVTQPISVAAVAAEQTARITADGYLSGKYTLTVIAGNVVTGMNITSSSGGGTNVSSVIFRATDFQIYNGTSGLTMFSVSGSNVNLAGVLTVSTSGKVFVGAGNWLSADTPFFLDTTGGGRLSLGSTLRWDGTNLAIAGAITATSGNIGGWTINSTTLSNNNATLDSAGQLVLGTASDVVIMSATDAVYRLWAGDTNAGTATFAVSKHGAIWAVSGIIAGFTLSTTSFSSSTGNYIEMNAATGYFQVGANITSGDSVLASNSLVISSGGNTCVDLRQTIGNGHMELFNSTGTQTVSVSGSTGTVSLNGNQIITSRQAHPTTLTDVITAGQTHGLWS